MLILTKRQGTRRSALDKQARPVPPLTDKGLLIASLSIAFPLSTELVDKRREYELFIELFL